MFAPVLNSNWTWRVLLEQVEHVESHGIVWQEMYESARLVGKEEVGERDCYKLELQPKPLLPLPEAQPQAKTPAPDIWFLDVETTLPRRILSRSTGDDGGLVEVQSDFFDWREVEGRQFAHTRDVTISGAKMRT